MLILGLLEMGKHTTDILENEMFNLCFKIDLLVQEIQMNDWNPLHEINCVHVSEENKNEIDNGLCYLEGEKRTNFP